MANGGDSSVSGVDARTKASRPPTSHLLPPSHPSDAGLDLNGHRRGAQKCQRSITLLKAQPSHKSSKALEPGVPHYVSDLLGIPNIAHNNQKFCARRGRDGDGAETEQPLEQ